MSKINFQERIKNLSPNQRRLLMERLRHAVGGAKEKGAKEKTKLVAYVKSGDATPSEIQSFVKERLPDYMVPSAFVLVEDFPRLPNGKIDQKALQSFEGAALLNEPEFVAPSTSIEKKLAVIWEQVLDFSPIGLHDNFFEIGGDSILSIQIIAKARNEGISLASNQLFEHQSIGELASFVEMKTEEAPTKEENAAEGADIVFSLTGMQEAFLFHHLQEEKGQGILNAQLVLEGELDREKLEQAWQKTIQKHGVLRTSVHWEDGEKPVQIIHRNAEMPMVFEDLTDLNTASFNDKIKQVKSAISLDLSKAPVSEFHLFKQNRTRYIFIWSCHHLLLDGWSTALIIKDLFLNYGALVQKKQLPSNKIPYFKTYIDWLQLQNEKVAKTFWRGAVKPTENPALFKPDHQSKTAAHFKDHDFVLSKERTDQLKSYARQHRITPSTIIKGLWGLLLGRYFENDRVVFGATVSGRSATLQGIDEMTGLFMNILPVQLKIDHDLDFINWIKNVQVREGQAINFEHNTLNQIQAWTDAKHPSLFDSLLVFENFPWNDLETGGLRISGFKGGVTTTYPLNLMVIPLDPYEFVIRYDQSVLEDGLVEWLANGLAFLLEEILTAPEAALIHLFNHIKIAPKAKEIQTGLDEKPAPREMAAPQNDLELKLVKIWEKVLGYSPIGVEDHFFEMGGSSLQAVRLLGMMKDRLGHNVSPAQLLENPTIRKMAVALREGESKPGWSSLVPLRASGPKTPLFCIHAGGGHTFFYKNLLPYLSDEQPVYSLQATGLDTGALHEDAAEMAKDYLKEVREVQPDGPYIFLVYCFSAVVGMEISKQLQAEGHPAPMVIVVDTAPYIPKPVRLTTGQRIHRYLNLPLEEKWEAVIEKLRSRFGRLQYKTIKNFGNEQVSTLVRAQERLVRIYDEYERTPFRGKITLIRSTGTVEELRDGDWHIDHWDSLALDGLDVYVVEGKHELLFEEPDVGRVAMQVQVCMDGFNDR